MKTATKVRDLEYQKGPKAAFYRLSDRLKGFDYVVVSAVLAAYVHETYIFGCDENGHVIDWIELPGSTRDVFDHKTVLNKAGYEMLI